MNILPILVSLASLTGQGQTPSKATMMAATWVSPPSLAGQVNYVKLRWVMDDGWFPNGGFNLYRTMGSQTVKLNAKPMAINTSTGDQMVGLATQQVVVGGQQRFFNATAGARTSSSTTFRAIVSGAQTAAATPGTSAASIRQGVAPLLQAFNSKLVKPAARSASASSAEQVGAARSHLILAAFMSDSNASAAGLGFTDNGTTPGITSLPGFNPGASMTYVLKAVMSGVETQVSSLNFVVGQDPLPPAPVVEAPVQLSEYGLTLHMEIPPGVDESAYGLLYFKVTRTDASDPAPVQLGKGPIFPAYLATTAGGEIPALTTYFDALDIFHIGPVKYSVTTCDAFGRTSAPVTISATFLNLLTPAPVPASEGSGVVSGQSVSANVNWVPSPDEGTNTAFVGHCQYQIDRTNDDGAPPRWGILTSNAGSNLASPNTLRIADLTGLYPSFAAAFVAALPRPEIVVPGAMQSLAHSLQTWTVAQVEAKYNMTTMLKPYVSVFNFSDTTVQPDHYYKYRVTAMFSKPLVRGSGATSQDVGVPAVVAPSAPGALGLVDNAPPPNLATITSSATNVLRLQPAHGVFIPGGQSASQGSVAAGRSMFGKYGGVLKGAAGRLTTSVPDNYGRMETLTWSEPAYSSLVSFDVYRANATGFSSTSAVNLSDADRGLRASAETTTQKGRAQVKLKLLPGLGAFRSSSSRHQFTYDTPPPPSAYVKIGHTKPGETTFVDLLPRCFANTYYYYVVPVNRWGLTGPAGSASKIKIKPSLPPSVPALLTVEATQNQTIVATIQPNLQVEDAEKYVLYRLAIPTSVTVTDSAGSQSTVTGGKFVSGTSPKVSAGTKVTASAFGRALLATGADSGGSIKFGIARKSSALSGFAAYQGQVKAALLNKLSIPEIPGILQAVLALTTYQPVGTTAVDPSGTAPVVITDTSAQSGSTYAYYIVAVNGQGMTSDPSAILDAEVMHVFANPPTLTSPPAYDTTKNSISFKVLSVGAQMFVIERALDGVTQSQWAQVGSVAADAAGAATVTDGMVRAGGQTYYYRVSAFDVDGNSSVHTPPNASAPVGYLQFSGKST